MKKYLLLLVLSLLFVVPIGANAATKNMRIDFDSHDKFNYFYEQKNNTEFYQFLVGHGDKLGSILNDYAPNHYYNDKGFNIKLFYSSELDFSNYNFTMPDNTYYVIATDSFDDEFTSYIKHIKYDGKSIYLGREKDSDIPYCFGLDIEDTTVFYFFDESATYLGYYIPNFVTSSNQSTSGCDVLIDNNYDVSSTKNADFTYFISKYYYYNEYVPFYTYNTDFIVSELYIDGKIYLIDDNANYSRFLSFFRNLFTSSENYDVVNTNLEYFKINKVFTNSPVYTKSLFDMLNAYSKGISVPSNFVSVEVSDLFGTYLVPKVTNINVNSNIYISSTGFPKIRIAYWSLVDGVVTYLGNDKRTEEEIIRSNFVGYLNYMPKIENNDLLFYNYLYHFSYQNAASENNSPLKYTYTLYYNPDVFNVVYYSSTDGVIFDYPGTDLEVVLTPDDIANNNYSGATSENIFATDYGNGSLGDYIDWLDSISTNPDGTVNFASVLAKIVSFIQSFSLIVTTIFSLVTLVYSSLPEEVQILLLFGLVSGFIIIIYKLIRG